MRLAIILSGSIAILTQLAYPISGSHGQIVIYLEQIQQPEGNYSIRIDAVRLRGSHQYIDIVPFENVITSDRLRSQQYLLADSVIEPGTYGTFGISGILEITPRSANVPQWGQVEFDTELPITLTVARDRATTLFFRINVEIPPDTTQTPKVILAEVSKTIPPRNSVAYVSNMASNNLTVVNRITGQVVSTILVGEVPRGMALAETRGLLFVANSESNTISVIEAETQQPKQDIALDFGDAPEVLSVSDDERYLISVNRGSNSVTIFDLSSLQPSANLPVGTAPVDAAVDRVTNVAYVVNNLSNDVTIIDLSTLSEVRTISVGSSPVAIDINSADRKAYVANYNSGYLTVINVDDQAVSGWLNLSISVADLRVDTFSDIIFCINRNFDYVTVFEPSLGVSLQDIRVGKYPEKIRLDPEGAYLYVTCRDSNNIYVISRISRRVERTIATGRKPYMVIFP
jgi:YVTN family beta-propeller protein